VQGYIPAVKAAIIISILLRQCLLCQSINNEVNDVFI